MEITPIERFEQNKNLAFSILKNYHISNKHSKEDLKSAAMMGLWIACIKYDSAYKIQFSTYAYNCIRNSILETLKVLTNYDNRTKTSKKFYSLDVDFKHVDFLIIEDELLSKTLYFDILKLLNKYLTKEQYKVFVLHELYNYSFRQIEVATNIKKETARLYYLKVIDFINTEKENKSKFFRELKELEND